MHVESRLTVRFSLSISVTLGTHNDGVRQQKGFVAAKPVKGRDLTQEQIDAV